MTEHEIVDPDKCRCLGARECELGNQKVMARERDA